jgi:hypothetical protein
MDFIETKQGAKAKSARVFTLLQKHQISVIVEFRFL